MSRAAWLVAVWLVCTPVAAQSTIDYRTIDADITLRLPSFPCQIPSAALQIARSLGLPGGVEGLPERCPHPRAPPPNVSERLSLGGMTAREAMDALVRIDSHYRWVESGGVLVLRPVDAWDGANHFLHRTVASFGFSDANVNGAVSAVQKALGPWRFAPAERPTTEFGARRFSLTLGATSILEALSAVVRAHGALSWHVTYCQPL
jgi:hypothetical protein